MVKRSLWSDAAERVGQTLFAASFFPSAALSALVLTRTLATARDVLFDGIVLLTVSALATGVLFAVSRQGDGRSPLRWCGMALLSFATQIAVAFGAALIWVAVVHPDRPGATPPRGKDRLHRRSTIRSRRVPMSHPERTVSASPRDASRRTFRMDFPSLPKSGISAIFSPQLPNSPLPCTRTPRMEPIAHTLQTLYAEERALTETIEQLTLTAAASSTAGIREFRNTRVRQLEDQRLALSERLRRLDPSSNSPTEAHLLGTALRDARYVAEGTFGLSPDNCPL